jgi:MFS superfamily sulfate permease-like transporter
MPVHFCLGFFLEFISIPVIAGFTSAASLRTAILQLKPLLGLKIPKGKQDRGVDGPYVHGFEPLAKDILVHGQYLKGPSHQLRFA